jgi:hypothetical protein
MRIDSAFNARCVSLLRVSWRSLQVTTRAMKHRAVSRMLRFWMSQKRFSLMTYCFAMGGDECSRMPFAVLKKWQQGLLFEDCFLRIAF